MAVDRIERRYAAAAGGNDAFPVSDGVDESGSLHVLADLPVPNCGTMRVDGVTSHDADPRPDLSFQDPGLRRSEGQGGEDG